MNFIENLVYSMIGEFISTYQVIVTRGNSVSGNDAGKNVGSWIDYYWTSSLRKII